MQRVVPGFFFFFSFSFSFLGEKIYYQNHFAIPQFVLEGVTLHGNEGDIAVDDLAVLEGSCNQVLDQGKTGILSTEARDGILNVLESELKASLMSIVSLSCMLNSPHSLQLKVTLCVLFSEP